MILYMTWFSERGRELAARIAELSLSVSLDFGRAVTVVTLQFQRYR